jgi:NAD(P)-dependent dehydrogenase (short-subunit alcohol dehydrogenase family)
MLPLDVRSEQSVCACVEQVIARAGRIDVLINNAGYPLVSLVEEASLQQVKEQFETNFFGAIRVIQAVLPHMRRQLAGRIINVSSIAGQIGLPGQPFYCASKFALEGLTEGLLYEVERFGIEVCLVQPGFFKTEIDHSAVEGDRPLPAYDSLRGNVRATLQRGLEAAPSPIRFARLVARIIDEPNPRLRYSVGNNTALTLWCKTLLPMRLFARGVRRAYRIGRWRWKAQLHRDRQTLREQME